jgi:uncharacterized protein (DUF1501 family)
MEAAYRMQFEALQVYDIRKEPEEIRAEYGKTPFANGCLMARRLVEAGVRFIHVYYGAGQPWDDHKGINKELTARCPDIQAAAALIRDLKRRGQLDSTLVVWGGEFGRTQRLLVEGHDYGSAAMELGVRFSAVGSCRCIPSRKRWPRR